MMRKYCMGLLVAAGLAAGMGGVSWAKSTASPAPKVVKKHAHESTAHGTQLQSDDKSTSHKMVRAAQAPSSGWGGNGDVEGASQL